MLEATGIAGKPNSHFHVPTLDGWCDAYGLAKTDFVTDIETIHAVVAAALVRGRGGTDMFGLRLQGKSATFFFEQIAKLAPNAHTDFARFEAVFGPTKLIRLRRADKLAQAVSCVKAQQTGLWHRHADGSELERLSPPRPPAFDRAAIDAEIALAKRDDDLWDAWLPQQNQPVLNLTYEDLSADPIGTLAHVLAHIGLDPNAAQKIDVPTARLTDAINIDWMSQYADRA